MINLIRHNLPYIAALALLPSVALAQDPLSEALADTDKSLSAAFKLDYPAVVTKIAQSLDSDIDTTIQCAGDLMLHSIVDNDEVSAAVYVGLAEIYFERGKLLRKTGEKMPKSAKRWMKLKKWSRGVPDSFDSYGEPRFKDLDVAGEKAFIGNANNCRKNINSVMTEDENAALALNATLRTLN